MDETTPQTPPQPEPQKKILLCVLWGRQHVPSERMKCSGCGAGVAVDALNIEDIAEYDVKCAACIVTMMEANEVRSGGDALIGGQKVQVKSFSLDAIKRVAEIERRWKKARRQ